MVDETRFQKVEAQVTRHSAKLKDHSQMHESYNRRFDDQVAFNTATTATLAAQNKLIETIQKSTKVQEDILKALTIMGTFARWVLAISGLCALIVAAVKGLRF